MKEGSGGLESREPRKNVRTGRDDTHSVIGWALATERSASETDNILFVSSSISSYSKKGILLYHYWLGKPLHTSIVFKGWWIIAAWWNIIKVFNLPYMQTLTEFIMQ